MAKTKAEKITSIEEEIRQLENRRRQLVQEQKAQERKDRTKRLCKRMGLFESLLPESISLTDEQFQIFLEMSDQARRILDELTARNAPTAPAQDAETAAQGNTPPAAKTAHTAREDSADGDAGGGGLQG